MVLVLIAGCGQKAGQPAPPRELVIGAAPAPAATPVPAVAPDGVPAAPPDPDAAHRRPLAAPAPPVEEAKPEEQTEMWMSTLESMVADFSLSHNRPPNDLNELVALKLLPAVPPGPRGKKFSLDPKSHRVVLVDNYRQEINWSRDEIPNTKSMAEPDQARANRLHADRVAGGDCDHCRPGVTAAARAERRQAKGKEHLLLEQSQADRGCQPHLS
jgi:hypothetical protein